MSLLNDQDKHQLLSKSILFSQLDIKDLDKLIRFMKSKHFKAREVIFHKADPGNQMCIITSGRVKLSTLSEEGKEMMYGMLEPGDIFGEISLLDGEQRSATVTATKPTDLLIIERRDLIPFLEQHPKVAIKLLAILASRLRKTDEIFEDTLFRNLPSKLAKKLLALADDYGEQTARGVKINLKLSQQEIGNLVGTSRESINKQLRAWEGDGLLTFHKGYITILQPDELEDLLYLSW
jgi:CRP/FNR family cyclic AMP-dependent transcriptional regulator